MIYNHKTSCLLPINYLHLWQQLRCHKTVNYQGGLNNLHLLHPHVALMKFVDDTAGVLDDKTSIPPTCSPIHWASTVSLASAVASAPFNFMSSPVSIPQRSLWDLMTTASTSFCRNSRTRTINNHLLVLLADFLQIFCRHLVKS